MAHVVYPEHSSTRAFHSHTCATGTLMRFTASILGWSLDLSLEPTTTEAADTCSLDGGLTASTAVGFAPQWAASEDVPMPQRVPGWDEPEERA